MWPSVTDDPDKKDASGGYTSSDFARALEIETQELEDALDKARREMYRIFIGLTATSEFLPDPEVMQLCASLADAALARHRANQPPTP